MNKKIYIIILLALSIPLSGLAQFTDWEKDIECNGISLNKLRYSTHGPDTTAIIGSLSSDQIINGIPCAKDWVHFSKDWEPEVFCLSTEHNIVNLKLPEDTWVLLSPIQDYHAVVFPEDTLINNIMCRGGGGSKGFRTKFYDSGELRGCFIKKNTEIDGIPCKAGVIYSLSFHENGKLHSAFISKNFTYEDIELIKGQRIYLDEEGSLILSK